MAAQEPSKLLVRVRSSSPAPHHTSPRLTLRRGVAQSGSASGWGPEGRWFESSRPDLPRLLWPGFLRVGRPTPGAPSRAPSDPLVSASVPAGVRAVGVAVGVAAARRSTAAGTHSARADHVPGEVVAPEVVREAVAGRLAGRVLRERVERPAVGGQL